MAVGCYFPMGERGSRLCKHFLANSQDANLEIFPSSFRNSSTPNNVAPLRITVRSNPIGTKYQGMDPTKYNSFSGANVVVTVQTFRNKITGPSLYMFMRYYLNLGWRVIVYDRYGLHADVMSEFLSLPEVLYHNHTVFEILFPSSFNKELAARQQVRVVIHLCAVCNFKLFTHHLLCNRQSSEFKHWHFYVPGDKPTKKSIGTISVKPSEHKSVLQVWLQELFFRPL